MKDLAAVGYFGFGLKSVLASPYAVGDGGSNPWAEPVAGTFFTSNDTTNSAWCGLAGPSPCQAFPDPPRVGNMVEADTSTLSGARQTARVAMIRFLGASPKFH